MVVIIFCNISLGMQMRANVAQAKSGLVLTSLKNALSSHSLPPLFVHARPIKNSNSENS